MSVYPPDFDPSEQQGETPTTIFVSDHRRKTLGGAAWPRLFGHRCALSLLRPRNADALAHFASISTLRGRRRRRAFARASGAKDQPLSRRAGGRSDSAVRCDKRGAAFLPRPIDVQARCTRSPPRRRQRTARPGVERFVDSPRPRSLSAPPMMRGRRSPAPQAWSDTLVRSRRGRRARAVVRRTAIGSTAASASGPLERDRAIAPAR